MPANLETITAERAKEIIEMNRRGEKPESLHSAGHVKQEKAPVDLLAGDSITRFDQTKKKKKKNNKKPRTQDSNENVTKAKEGEQNKQ